MHALLAGLSVLFVAQTPRSTLPLTRLVLYENGVGYFERRGVLGSRGVAEIPLEAGQLDDALKSLVVVSDARLASVEFTPPLAVDAARAMAGMPSKDNQRSLENLLRALQGVEVVVTREGGGALVKGSVIDVSEEPGPPDKDGKREPEQTLLVFGEAGLSKVALQVITSVRPTGSQVALAWRRAVGATSLQPERERLLVRGASSGGAVGVGYTTEAPVWRTTYRLVLGPKLARLQGYALVHNDSDEAWRGVRVTLASGKPTSFLFPLAGPRYGRRELISPVDGLETAPQLATREAREHLRGSLEDRDVAISSGSVGGYGTGSGHGSVSHTVTGHGAVSGLSSTVLEDGPTPLEPAAVSEAGDLFLYSVKEPVVLGARQSALLPIIDGAITAERVTVLDGEGAVRSGVRLQNSTALTLEAGTVSVFADGSYAGETQVDRVKPREVRVLTHGFDLDLLVENATTREEGAARKARLTGAEGARLLEVTRVDRLVHQVSFTSRATTARTVLVLLSDTGYRVVGGGEEDERSPEQPRYGRIKVAPRATEEVELIEEGAVVERLAASALSSAKLTQLLSQQVPPDVRALLERVKSEVERAEAAERLVVELDTKLKALEADQTRLRDDLGALGKGGASGAAQKVGERLLGVEDQLAKLRRERETAGALTVAVRRKLMLAAR